jgi:Tat protein secretion system quality control protein TatD with DNase activity
MAESITKNEDAFPWHLGVYDAHCHPTDTMSLTSLIPSMKTRILTIMATRLQDQDLVAQMAEAHGVKSSNSEQWEREECIVPCFGWHPWFGHQMYATKGDREEQEDKVLLGEDKVEHYKKVFKKDNPTEDELSIFKALPDPMPFSQFLSQTREYLEKYPYALVGEIGLDRGIRVPDPRATENKKPGDEDMTPGSREGKKLANLKPDPQHQKMIFMAQMKLAADMRRAVSIHGVQAHGMLFETIQEMFKGHEKKVLTKKERKKVAQEQNLDLGQEQEDQDGPGFTSPQPYPPRICLHSYSGDYSTLARYHQPSVPIEVFASFSTAVNLSDTVEEDTPQSFIDLIKKVPDHLLLVESDLHTAGEDMDRRMEDIVRRICNIKGWELEQGVGRLGKNWKRFVFGGEGEWNGK